MIRNDHPGIYTSLTDATVFLDACRFKRIHRALQPRDLRRIGIVAADKERRRPEQPQRDTRRYGIVPCLDVLDLERER